MPPRISGDQPSQWDSSTGDHEYQGDPSDAMGIKQRRLFKLYRKENWTGEVLSLEFGVDGNTGALQAGGSLMEGALDKGINAHRSFIQMQRGPVRGDGQILNP